MARPLSKQKFDTQKDWVRYWSRSLKDSEMAEIKIEDFRRKDGDDFILVDNFSPNSNSLPDIYLEKYQQILTRQKKDEAEVYIAPLQIESKKAYNTISPFWYAARIDKRGHFHIPEETTPIITRKFLSPVFDDGSDESFVFGALDDAEKAVAQTVAAGPFEDYKQYIDYVLDVFKTIAGKSLQSCRKERGADDSYFQAYFHKIHPSTAVIVFPKDKMISMAGKHLRGLYDYLLDIQEKDGYPVLLSKMISEHEKTAPFLPKEEWISFNQEHLGQMSDEYPLSYTQRRSLYTILSQWEHPVQVVNGPPGTGKTTLLQSIVADMMVKSVIKKDPRPCIIWGSAATNQAVTNIIESFSKGAELEKVRWLPIESSFHGGLGTFFPSSRVKEEELQDINYVKYNYEIKKETGTFTELETSEYLEKAETIYIENGRNYFKSQNLNSVEGIVRNLKKTIESYVQLLKDITSSAKELKKLSEGRNEYWCDGNTAIQPDVIEKDFKRINDKLKAITERINILQSERKDFRQRQNNEETAVHVLSQTIENLKHEIAGFMSSKSDVMKRDADVPFLKELFFGKRIHAKNQKAIEGYQHQISISTTSLEGDRKELQRIKENLYSINKTVSDYKSRIEKAEKEKADYAGKQKDIEKLLAEWEKWNETWKQIQQKCNSVNKVALPIGDDTGFYNELDKLRAILFALSVRYWEGRWVLETKQAIEQQLPSRNDKASTISRLRRRAMLTPCFVSTFHSAPRVLNYYEEKTTHYLLDFVDCLIVDEAGQASPEISVGPFALAKKAVVVGDIKQIEPVWNILDAVDKANLEEFVHSPYGYNDFDGRRCSCGSIMRIAQAACAVKDDTIAERGNILLEHYRCAPEIINYCSELAYEGQIVPSRKSISPEKMDGYFPEMGFFNVESSFQTKQGHLRNNPDESRTICQWLINNQEAIVNKYGGSVESCVGILTPFRGQKHQLYKDLKDAKFNADGFKLGTVHAMQGAERPIVLFSSVYTKSDHVSKNFFDEGVNMLNVAVSRAKDSFILFGDARIFDNPETPSGKLYEIVKQHEITTQLTISPISESVTRHK